jgi:hypothetical protein
MVYPLTSCLTPANRLNQFRQATAWLALIAASLTIGLGAQMVLVSFFTTPDFWQLPHLVQLGAECLMLFFVLFACCSPAGYAWLLLGIALDVQLGLLVAHLNGLKRIPPPYLRLWRQDPRQQKWAVRATQARLEAQLAADGRITLPPVKPPSVSSSKRPCWSPPNLHLVHESN